MSMSMSKFSVGNVGDRGAKILSTVNWVSLQTLYLFDKIGNQGILWLAKAQIPELKRLLLCILSDYVKVKQNLMGRE